MKSFIKNILKLFFTFLGIAILVYGITTGIDGVGRFAIILSGTVFSVIGSFMSFGKPKAEKEMLDETLRGNKNGTD